MGITIKRHELSTWGCVATNVTGWLTAARARRVTTGLVGRVGQARGTKGPAPVRVLTVDLLAPLTDVTHRDRIIGGVEADWMDQLVPIGTVDRPGVETWAECVDLQWGELPEAPAFLPPLVGRATFEAVDGGSEDLLPSVVRIGTTPTEVPCGTLGSAGLLYVWGYTAPLVVTYWPATGGESTTLVVAPTLAAGEHAVLDLQEQEAWRATSGSTRTVLSTSGPWPALDAIHRAGRGLVVTGDTTRQPALSVSSGSAVWVGRRRWRI